jgi:hypothetical protein
MAIFNSYVSLPEGNSLTPSCNKPHKESNIPMRDWPWLSFLLIFHYFVTFLFYDRPHWAENPGQVSGSRMRKHTSKSIAKHIRTAVFRVAVGISCFTLGWFSWNFRMKHNETYTDMLTCSSWINWICLALMSMSRCVVVDCRDYH